MRTAAVISLLSALVPATTARYLLADAYVGPDFFSTWTWQTISDPTDGDVNYVNETTAVTRGLSWATGNKFFMRADDTNVVANDTRGRVSIRILSNKAYNDSVTVLDLQHMPQGCATWPAFWSLSATGPWPVGGEIDIIEGVNLQTGNLMSLHTTPNCNMSSVRTMTGAVTSTICDTNYNYNQGCGVSGSAASYGSAFNAAGGGYFVMERSNKTGIRAWFWPRGSLNVPLAVSLPATAAVTSIQPDDTWGEPYAVFPMGALCDYETHFNAHQYVFDLTFCGDWAGAAYPTDGCPGTCTNLVNNHPRAFSEAYWEVNGLYVFTPNGQATPPNPA